MAVLKKGAKGKPVTQLQKALNKNGAKPKLKEDGIFGPLTDAALRAYQKKNKMKPDGIAGPNTNFALNLGPRPKSLKWPLKGYDPSREQKDIEAGTKEIDTNFAKYLGILKTAIVENEALKKILMDRAKIMDGRKKSVGKFLSDLNRDGKELIKLHAASEKSDNFAEIKEMHKKAEDIYAQMDDGDVDDAMSQLKSFDETIKDIEKFQEGVKALKSKLKKI